MYNKNSSKQRRRRLSPVWRGDETRAVVMMELPARWGRNGYLDARGAAPRSEPRNRGRVVLLRVVKAIEELLSEERPDDGECLGRPRRPVQAR